MNICDLSAAELHSHYVARNLSPVEATRAALERAETVQPKLNCFVHLDAEQALTAARESEKRYAIGAPASVIDGVPTTIKDVVLTKGWVLGRGSRVSAKAPPAAHDAPSVAKLRKAGAILIGSTTTCEGGWKAVTDSPLTGTTRNPFDLALTPGGSSGGASAALASGAGALALGSDGGGSVRVPASFTGTVGFKPQYGRIPQYPIGPHYGNMSHLGPMARSVHDAWAMFRTLAGRHNDDPDSLADTTFVPLKSGDLTGLRIAVTSDFGFLPLDPEIASAFARVPAMLEDMGATIFELKRMDDWRDPYRTLWSAGAHQGLRRFSDEERQLIDPGLVAVAEQGAKVTLNQYLEAQVFRQELRLHMSQAFTDLDAVISPTVSVLPFTAGQEMPTGFDGKDWLDWAGFSLGFNMTGQPAVSIPFARSGSGLPIGLQIATEVHKDAMAMQIAAAIEGALDLTHRLPGELVAEVA